MGKMANKDWKFSKYLPAGGQLTLDFPAPAINPWPKTTHPPDGIRQVVRHKGGRGRKDN